MMNITTANEKYVTMIYDFFVLYHSSGLEWGATVPTLNVSNLA